MINFRGIVLLSKGDMYGTVNPAPFQEYVIVKGEERRIITFVVSCHPTDLWIYDWYGQKFFGSAHLCCFE
jgi:hypothetical protein